MTSKLFGGTKLGFISTIVTILGTVLVGIGGIGSTINNNIVVCDAAIDHVKKQAIENDSNVRQIGFSIEG